MPVPVEGCFVSVKEHAWAWPGLPLGVNYTCVGHACSFGYLSISLCV